MMAGLGIIRKNNFFYTKKGSFVELVGYVIDQKAWCHHVPDIRPCAESCHLCQTHCPSGALKGPFTMSRWQCVSFIIVPLPKENSLRAEVIRTAVLGFVGVTAARTPVPIIGSMTGIKATPIPDWKNWLPSCSQKNYWRNQIHSSKRRSYLIRTIISLRTKPKH